MKTLNELFNNPTKYKKVTDISKRSEYQFTIDGMDFPYSVTFIYFSDGSYLLDKPYWTISFAYEDPDLDDPYETLGVGNEIKVFSTVIKIIKDFEKEKNVETFLFSGKGNNRQKLYKTLIKKLGKGFKMKKDGNMFILSRKSK